jgi:NADH-quinone oxidoreductase subunit M
MTLVPLILWAFWIGVYPKPYFNVLKQPVSAIVEQLNPDFYKAPQAASAKPTLPEQPQISITLSNPTAGANR